MKNCLYQCANLGMIAILGNNAPGFLQGQLSCDITLVNSGRLQQGALCNVKGRVQALVDVINYHDVLHLLLPNNLLPIIEKSLAKVALVSRVNLHKAQDYAIYGFYLAERAGQLPPGILLPEAKHGFYGNDHAFCYALGNNYYLIGTNNNCYRRQLLQAFPAEQLLNADAWHYQRLTQLQVQIYPETSGLFLPHRLNLPQFGYISFTKGCYKGQEIVARMHYRSTQKYILCVFNVSADRPLLPADKLYHSETKMLLGEIIDCCLINHNDYLIIVSILPLHPPTVLFALDGIPCELKNSSLCAT